MNKTQYDDILVKALNIISKVLEWKNRFKIHIKRFKFFKFKVELSKNIIRIKAFETTPKGHYAINYCPVKFTFKDELEQDFFNNIKNLPIYLQDYSDVDFSAGYFIVRQKSAACRLIEGVLNKSYRDTHLINEYIKSGELFDNLFYITELSKEDFKLERKEHPERIMTPLIRCNEDDAR